MTSYKALIILTVIFYIKSCVGDKEEANRKRPHQQKYGNKYIETVNDPTSNSSNQPMRSEDINATSNLNKECETALTKMKFNPELGVYNLIYTLQFQSSDEFKEHIKNKTGNMSEFIGDLGNSLYTEACKKIENIKSDILTPEEYCDNSVKELDNLKILIEKGIEEGIKEKIIEKYEEINIDPAKCKEEIRNFKYENDSKLFIYDETNGYENFIISHDIIMSKPVGKSFKDIIGIENDKFFTNYPTFEIITGYPRHYFLYHKYIFELNIEDYKNFIPSEICKNYSGA